MEKEGLIKAVSKLEDEDLEIGMLVTDRHTGVAKWVRDNLPNTKHKFDVWHVAKGTDVLYIFTANKYIINRSKEETRQSC